MKSWYATVFQEDLRASWPRAVCAGGQVTLPDDILVGDRDGIAVIHPEDAKEVLEAVKKKFAMETEKTGNYKDGNVDYDKHQVLYREQMEKDGFLYIGEEYADQI